MIDLEVKNNIEQTAQRFAQQGIDIKSTFTPELVKSLAESSRPEAEKNVLRNLSLKALSEKEKITISDKDIDIKLKEYENEIKNSPNKIDINRLREVIKNDLLKDKLISWLEENSEIIEKKVKNTEAKQKTTKSNSKNVKAKSSKSSKKSKEKK
tara:strand:- start:862 stop:1323 length:462 start_codon:yes stop_codon:yes gene_type:complete